MIQPGVTFFPVLPPEQKPHRYVVTSDPQAHPTAVLIVNFTSFHVGHSDPACVIGPNEFSALTNESCIAYARADSTTVEALEAAITEGKFQLKEPVPPGVLRKIREGFGRSEQVKNRVKKIAQAQKFFAP